MDEGRHSDHMISGGLRFHVPRQLQVLVVLPGHLGEPQIGDVELLDPDEVKKELERSLERIQADFGRSGRRGGRPRTSPRRKGRGFVQGARLLSIFIAARTSSIVLRASACARRAPSARISCTRPRSWSSRDRRSWIGSSTGRRCSRR